MSRYIKLEDAIRNINLEVNGRKEYTGDMKANLFFALDDLPTIEVSEDCISRKWLEKNFQTVCENVRCNECPFNSDDCRLIEFIVDAPKWVR